MPRIKVGVERQLFRCAAGWNGEMACMVQTMLCCCASREKNKEQVSASRKMKWKTSPRSVKLRAAMGSAIYRSLKRGAKGGTKWQDLVGYTAVDLMRHMERQFVKGMSWDNYGAGWHIDHIVPVSSFQIESPQDNEFQQCWALSNLRPLWARENLVKRAKHLYLL